MSFSNKRIVETTWLIVCQTGGFGAIAAIYQILKKLRIPGN